MNEIEQIITLLTEAATDLDAAGLSKSASGIDKIASNIVMVKKAQYVGVQGYAIRNKRCFDNCIRQKRASKKNLASQEVWFECLKEYEASINNDGSIWDKYASDNDAKQIKTASVDVESSVERLRDQLANLKLASTGLGKSETVNKEVLAKIDQSYDLLQQHIEKEAQWKQNLKGLWNQFTNKAVGRNKPQNFNSKNLGTIISQLENTLNGYKQQRQTLVSTLSQVQQQGGQPAEVASQMIQLTKNLNANTLQQMKGLLTQLEQPQQQVDQNQDGVPDQQQVDQNQDGTPDNQELQQANQQGNWQLAVSTLGQLLAPGSQDRDSQMIKQTLLEKGLKVAGVKKGFIRKEAQTFDMDVSGTTKMDARSLLQFLSGLSKEQIIDLLDQAGIQFSLAA